MRLLFVSLAAVATVAPGVVYAQRPLTELRPAPVNLDFAQGKSGERPAGWWLGPEDWMVPKPDAFAAEWMSGAECFRGGRCAVLKAVRELAAVRVAGLYQLVDATPYRGGTVAFRAAVRTAVNPAGSTRLFVRVHTPSGGTSYFDNMGAEPVLTSQWTFYEIHAPVAADARDIEFGLRLEGAGPAWIGNASLVWLDRTEASGVDEARAQVRRFADARDRRDARTLADVFAKDVVYQNEYGRVEGSTRLAEVFSQVSGGVQRTIQSVEMLTEQTAIAHVYALFEDGPAVNETYVLTRVEAGWRIQRMEAKSAGR